MVLCIIFALFAGVITAGGYFAVFSTLSIVPRFAQLSHTAKKVRLYESFMIAGAIIGNILFVFRVKIELGTVIMCLAVLGMGVFIGSFLISLAEMVKGFPVFARRSRIKRGFGVILLILAIGKLAGSLFYFNM